MEITIIGTGKMGRAIATRAIAGGHEVTLIGRDRGKAEALAGELGDSANAGDSVAGEAVVLAVNYSDAHDAVAQHRDALGGRALVDITNPVNESYDGLVDTPAGSAAEEIAAAVPDAHVVKAFNTTFGNTVEPGEVAGQPLDVFLAADDDRAKATVKKLVEDGGLRALDAGPLARARELESLAFLHIAMQGTLNSGFGSAIKVVTP